MNNFGQTANAATTVTTTTTSSGGADQKVTQPKAPLPIVVIKLMLDPNKLLTREDVQALAPAGGDTVILVDGAAPDCYLRRESRHKSVKRASALAKVIYCNAPNGLADTEHMIIPTRAGDKIAGVSQNDFVATIPAAVGSAEEPKPRLDEPFNIYKNASQHIQNAFALVRSAGYRVIIIPYYKSPIDARTKATNAKPTLAFNMTSPSMAGVIEREINRLIYDLYKTHIDGRGFDVGHAEVSQAVRFAYTNFLHKVGKLETFHPGTYDPAKVISAHRTTGGGETIIAMRRAKALQVASADSKVVAGTDVKQTEPATGVTQAQAFADKEERADQALTAFLHARPDIVELLSSALKDLDSSKDAKGDAPVTNGYMTPHSPARSVVAHSSVLQPVPLSSLRQPLLANESASAAATATGVVSYGSVGAKLGFEHD